LPPVVISSHPSPVRFPDDLVELHLQPGVEPVPDHPSGEPLRRNGSEGGGEEHVPIPSASITGRHVFRVPVIFLRGYDELHLVPPRQVAEVLPKRLTVLAGGRALHVHDLHRPGIEPGKGKRAVRLHQHFLPEVEQSLDEGVRLVLQQRLPSGDARPGEPEGDDP